MNLQFYYTYIYIIIWVFPKIGVAQNGWFMMEHPVKMDDLGVPLFLETPIYIYISLYMPTNMCIQTVYINELYIYSLPSQSQK